MRESLKVFLRVFFLPRTSLLPLSSHHLSSFLSLPSLFSLSSAPDPPLHDEDQHGMRLRGRDGKENKLVPLLFYFAYCFSSPTSTLKKNGGKKTQKSFKKKKGGPAPLPHPRRLAPRLHPGEDPGGPQAGDEHAGEPEAGAACRG